MEHFSDNESTLSPNVFSETFLSADMLNTWATTVCPTVRFEFDLFVWKNIMGAIPSSSSLFIIMTSSGAT